MKRWFKKTLNKKRGGKLRIVLTLLFGVILIASGYFWYVNRDTSVYCKSNISDKTLTDMAKILERPRSSDMEKMMIDIRSDRNADSSAICLYALAVDSLERRENEAAVRYSQKLQQLFGADYQLPNSFQVEFRSVSELIKHVEKVAKGREVFDTSEVLF